MRENPKDICVGKRAATEADVTVLFPDGQNLTAGQLDHASVAML